MGSMLDLASSLEKSEARDGVYAILGLLEHHENLSGPVTKTTAGTKALLWIDDLLKVDYSSPLCVVLQNATRYALWQNRSLDVLEEAIRRDDDIGAVINAGIPTWAARPDLLWNREEGKYLPSFFKAYYDEPASSALIADMSHGPEVLMLEDFVVDQISSQTSVCELLTCEVFRRFAIWLLEAKEIVQGDQSCIDQGREASIYEEMALAITGQASKTNKRLSVPDALEFTRWLREVDKINVQEDSAISALVKAWYLYDVQVCGGSPPVRYDFWPHWPGTPFDASR